MKLDFSAISTAYYGMDNDKIEQDYEKGIDVKSDEYLKNIIEKCYRGIDDNDKEEFFNDNLDLFWNNISDEEYKSMCENFVHHLYITGKTEELAEWIMDEYGKDKIWKENGYEEAAIEYIVNGINDEIDQIISDVEWDRKYNK